MSLTDADMEAIDDIGGEFAAGPQGIDENFEFDSSESTEETLESNGFIDMEGWYHFEITKAEFHLGLLTDEGKDNTPHIIVTCKSLTSVKNQSPAGSVLWHRIYVGQKGGGQAKQGSIDSMLRFGIGCGLLKWGKNDKGAAVPVLAKTGLTKIPLTAWSSSVGMQFVANVKKEKQDEGSEYKPKFSIPMGRTYRPDHPDVGHVVKNQESLEAIGIVLPTEVNKSAQGKAATTTPATSKSTTQPASSSAEKVEAAAAVVAERETVTAGGGGSDDSDAGFNMDDF